MRLIDHLFDDMLIDDAEVRVILPEGVLNIELSTPYPVKRESNNKHYTYLDTTGTRIKYPEQIFVDFPNFSGAFL